MSIRILFTTGREPEYPRNAVIRTALARNFDVISTTDSTRNLPLRYLNVSAQLLRSTRTEYDLMFVGFLGQPLMLMTHWLTRKPILFDAFLSIYDTLCFDRRRFSPGSVPGKLAFWLDRASCSYADRVLLDTQVHADYFHNTFGVPANKLRSLFVGCDENIFYPRQNQSTTPMVLYYGTYLPLQGIDVIIRAAKFLEGRSNVHFRIIGTGFEAAHIHSLVRELDVRNITFLPPVPLEALPAHIQEATICLGGHFGASAKAGRVIAGKTFQCIAMGKPTIVGDNIANHELLRHGHDAWFCRMNNPEALADAILHLIDDPELCLRLGNNAHQTFMEYASIQALSFQLQDIVGSMLG
jgi:glycosyltransferase involved in cell wall biosynthesis